MKLQLIIIASMVIGMVIGLTAFLRIHTLGEDSYLKPLLIKEECARYDKNTGEYIIQNLRSK